MVTDVVCERCFFDGGHTLACTEQFFFFGRNKVPQQFKMLIVMLRAVKPPFDIYDQDQ